METAVVRGRVVYRCGSRNELVCVRVRRVFAAGTSATCRVRVGESAPRDRHMSFPPCSRKSLGWVVDGRERTVAVKSTKSAAVTSDVNRHSDEVRTVRPGLDPPPFLHVADAIAGVTDDDAIDALGDKSPRLDTSDATHGA